MGKSDAYMRRKRMPDGKTRKVIVSFRLAGINGRKELSGIFRYLGSGHNWDLRILQSSEELMRELHFSKRNAIPAGFIVDALCPEEALRLLAATSVPTVAVDIGRERFSNRTRRLAFVRNDDGGVGICGAKHLLSLGNFRSFGFVHARGGKPWSARREKAFRIELSRKGRTCLTFTDAPDADPFMDRQTLAKWLAALPKPTAVMAAWDGRARQVLEACHDAKLSVPGQVALLGVDNDELLCEHTAPPLSSVLPDTEEEGFKAAEALDLLMNGDLPPRPHTILCRVKGVVERESTAPIAPAGQLIRRAIAFIRKNADKSVRVPDVVAYLGVSRRLADKRFRELQGETILETITRFRLEEIKRRLVSSRLPINRLSIACGFTNLNYLKCLFKRHVGVSMLEYRKKNKTTCPILPE